LTHYNCRIDLKEIANRIVERAGDFPAIIAVDGSIGSGKSYFGERLREALSPNSLLLAMDLFVCICRHEWEDRARAREVDLRRWYDIDKVKDALRSVKSGKAVELTGLYRNENGLLEGSLTLDPSGCRYFILEGLFSFDDALDGYVDFRVFVDVPPDVALGRAEPRDESVRHMSREDWLLKKKAYFDGYLPYIDEHRQKADFLLVP